MQLALDHTLLVDRLIVVDISPRRYAHHHDDIIKGMQLLAASDLTSRRQADELLQPFVANAGVRAFLLKNLQRDDNANYRLRVNIDSIAKNYATIASEITSQNSFASPVLFIKGAESDYLTDKDRDPIAALFPSATLKVIAGAGHWPHSEKPDVIHKVMSDFLAA